MRLKVRLEGQRRDGTKDIIQVDCMWLEPPPNGRFNISRFTSEVLREPRDLMGFQYTEKIEQRLDFRSQTVQRNLEDRYSRIVIRWPENGLAHRLEVDFAQPGKLSEDGHTPMPDCIEMTTEEGISMNAHIDTPMTNSPFDELWCPGSRT